MRAARIAVVLGAMALAAPEAGSEDAMRPHGGTTNPRNRLAGERSPYLRQHMHNPVDWRPWGPEAFAAAKAADKPVFLSVGYAACHWCHVMERESFEDEAAAAALNDVFVCVKVDREERPDVDEVYMASIQVTSGRGGWPMSVFLLPDGRPFLARTYLPKAALIETARRIGSMWRSDRGRLEGVAEEISNAVRQHASGPSLPPFQGGDEDLLRAAVSAASSEFDRERGGFDRVPKFPPHAHLLAFLDRDGATGGEDGLAMARRTLDAMAAGGIHDQVGGGFHRYSTDAAWLLPHFEKMLYDNALLAQAYAAAYARWKDPRHAEVLRGLLGWVVREMAVEGGGFASSLDADTEGEEGLTYTWTPAELVAALGPADAALAGRVYGVTPEGNFQDEATRRRTGRSILYLPRPLAAMARDHSRPVADLEADLYRIRPRLLEVRAKRAQPGRDGKVITSWNGLLVSAFVAAGRALDEPAWTARAKDLARFLLDHSRDGGRLLRFPKGSGPAIPAFLDDHAHMADGLLDLADATGDAAWAEAAQGLADAVLAGFSDPAGGFWSSGSAHESLLSRHKDGFDSPIPSGNATTARVLLRLAARTGKPAYAAAANATISAFRPLVARAPSGTMAFVRAVADRLAFEATGGGPAAPDAVVRRGPLRVEAFLERAEARPGTTVRVVLRVALDDGWHVNPSGPASGDLVPTTLALAQPSPVALDRVVFHPAAPAVAAGAADVGRALSGRFEVHAVLAIPAGAALGPRRVGLRLGFQPCDADSCRSPDEALVDLPLRFEVEDAPARHPAVFR